MAQSGKKHIDKKNMVTRIISGVVIALVLAFFIIMGGWWFYGFTAVISLIGLFEFYRIYDIHKSPIGIAGYFFGLLYLLVVALGAEAYRMPVLVLAFVVFMIIYVLDFSKIDASQAMASFFGLVYTVVMFSYMYLLREMPSGICLIILVLLCASGCDVFAYFTGSLFGKHKMAPVLSPKKSVEGAVGGFVGSILLGLIVALIAKSYMEAYSHPMVLSMGLAGLAALGSMFGDLTASAFKRNRNVKDYSHLIPGHGGILDRFDSYILVVPLSYLLVKLVLG